jgi:hypothetical protein
MQSRGLDLDQCGLPVSRSSIKQKDKAMMVNVGTIDRALRVVVGLALIAFALRLGFPDTGWNWIGWIGVVPLTTALIGNCPAYSVFGFSTK